MKSGKKLLAALLGVAFAGCATLAGAQEGPGVTKDEIVLGSWTDLSGPLVSYGVPGVAGQSAFYGMLNDAGGVNGRKVRVITEDHAYQPQRAVAAARKLVESDQVLAIQGSFGTIHSNAAFPYLLDEAAVPFVMPYAGSADWFAPNRPLIISAMMPYDDHAVVLGRWAAKDGAKKILIIHNAIANYEKVGMMAEPAAKAVNPDVSVEYLSVKLGTTDYAPIALEVVSKAPDAIISISTMAELAALAKELKQQNFSTKLYTYGGSVANDMIKLGGDAIEGLRAVSYTLPVDSDHPAVEEYRDAMAKYEPNEEPDYGSILTFALAKITAEALRNAEEPLNRESLVQAFYTLKDYDSGILGKVTLSPEQHLGVTTLQRVEVKDGKFVAVGDFVAPHSDW
jgi:ABC-type branched-subunit amino acid transport system substrate-binding protein